MTRRVGIYARLSQDRDGQQTATARQIADAKAYADLHGWTVDSIYQDVDLSAYKRGVVRPEYERLLDDIAARRIDGVVVWKLDRLVRRAREFERFWDVCEQAGATLASVQDPIDTSTDMGMVMVRVLVAFAQLEAATMSVRIRSAAAEQARNGRATTGGTRAFGLTSDRTAIVPDEAAMIREAVGRVTAGESLRGIASDWKRRGVASPSGKPWKTSPLRRMLIGARLAGLREHRGEIVADGDWPAIIDRSDLEGVRAVLSDPARRKFSGAGARRYLLTGFLRCSICGARMVARPRGDKVRRYVCAKGPSFEGCGGIAILSEPLEELVAEMVLTVLDSPAVAIAVREHAEATLPRPDADQLRADERALEELARDYYADRKIGRAEYFAARDALEARITDARRRLAARNGHDVLAGLPGAGAMAREAWASGSFDWRRSLIGALVDHVVIGQAVRGRNTFDASRVQPVWRY